MPDVFADLHTHTHCSDGAHAPADLVQRASDVGLRVLAVTDHDTVAGVAAAQEAAAQHALQVVTGVELSVSVEETEVHLLGYGFDVEDPGLTAWLEDMQAARRERAREILDRLDALGVPVDEATLRAEVGASASVGRPHIAAALVGEGHVPTRRAAFEQYLGEGQPAYVTKPPAPAADVLTLLHEAGGIGVLAHPGHWTSSRTIRRLVEVELDGIEVTHPAHDASLRQYYTRLARGYGLLRTGGSDYHGPSTDRDTGLGDLGMTRQEWERFRGVLA